MDRLKQCSQPDTDGTATTIKSNNTDPQVINDFVKIPESLHLFISNHKDSIGTGLYYVSLGSRAENTEEQKDQPEEKTPEKKEALKTLRFKLSPIAQEALEKLKEDGYSKKDAVISAIEYLKLKPATILKVKL